MASSVASIPVNFGGIGGHRTVKLITANLGVYAAGGIAITAAQCGLGALDAVLAFPAGGLIFEWVTSTGKMKAYQDVTPAAAAPLGEVGATDITTTVFFALAVGKP